MKTPDEIKKGLEYLSITDIAQKVEAAKRGLPYAYAEDIATDALAYIQQLEAKVPQWISVKERLPEEADEVLVFCRNGETTWTNLAHRVGKQWWRVGVPMQCVTHWMPLPEPPEEATTDDQ